MTYEQAADKLPPSDLEAEQAALGSILVEPDAAAIGLGRLVPDDFYREAHRVILAAMQRARDGGPVDFVTTCNALRERGELDSVGGAQYLQALIGQVPTAAHLIRYINILVDCRLRRELIKLGSRVQQHGYDGGNLEVMVRDAQEGLSVISEGRRRRGGTVSLEQICNDGFLEWHDEQLKSPPQIVGARLGIDSIDRKLGGLAEWDVICYRAFGHYGKSKLLRQAAIETSIQAGPVLFYLLEGNWRHWLIGCVAYLSGVDEAKLLRDGYNLQTDAEQNRVADAWSRLAILPIHLSIEARTVMDIRTDIELQFRSLRPPPAAIMIDYIQLMQDVKADNTMQVVNNALTMLTEMNAKTRVPVFLASQITVDSSGRHKTRWSEEVQNAAGLIWEIERGKRGSAETRNPDLGCHQPEIRLLPIKQRGPSTERLGVVELGADWACGRFTDAEVWHGEEAVPASSGERLWWQGK